MKTPFATAISLAHEIWKIDLESPAKERTTAVLLIADAIKRDRKEAQAELLAALELLCFFESNCYVVANRETGQANMIAIAKAFAAARAALAKAQGGAA